MEALLEQYKMLEETLREMKDFSVNMRAAIVSIGEAFKVTDKNLQNCFWRVKSNACKVKTTYSVFVDDVVGM